MPKEKTIIDKEHPHAGNGGVVPPVHSRFGQPNGNRQAHGYWKVTDTPRYKLEHMMKLTEEEVKTVAKDEKASFFERKIALNLAKGDWKTIESMINQVYGTPKQVVEQTNIKLKPILPKPAKTKEK